MRVFIDCEFNGYRGDLITMALVGEDGREGYWLMPTNPTIITDWVADNVAPVIYSGVHPLYTPHTELPHKIAAFLAPYDSVHLVADWPDDARFFCEYLITGPGERVDTPPLTIEIVRDDADSAVPHNALHNARGIRDMFLGIK